MKKHLYPGISDVALDRWKIKGHFELIVNPSELALEIWNHVLTLGVDRLPPGFDSRNRANRFGYVIQYVREGELIHTIKNRTFNVRAGGICIFDAITLRHQRNRGRKRVRLSWILFNGRTMPRIFAELGAEETPVFYNINSGQFENLFQELWRVAASQPPAYEATVHVLLSAILAECFKARTKDVGEIKLPKAAGPISDKIRTALDFVTRMYVEDIGLKHMADAVHLNISYFSRKFHREVGMAPIQYLYHFRKEHAKRLLRDTDLPVSEIARFVGIPDQKYFSRAFHKHTGDAPLAFRKKERATKVKKVRASPPIESDRQRHDA